MTSRDDEPTKPEKRSSQTLSQWGFVDVWLSQRDGRCIVMTAGMRLRVVDEQVGEVLTAVAPTEDVARVALRAIEELRLREVQAPRRG